MNNIVNDKEFGEYLDSISIKFTPPSKPPIVVRFNEKGLESVKRLSKTDAVVSAPIQMHQVTSQGNLKGCFYGTEMVKTFYRNKLAFREEWIKRHKNAEYSNKKLQTDFINLLDKWLLDNDMIHLSDDPNETIKVVFYHTKLKLFVHDDEQLFEEYLNNIPDVNGNSYYAYPSVGGNVLCSFNYASQLIQSVPAWDKTFHERQLKLSYASNCKDLCHKITYGSSSRKTSLVFINPEAVDQKLTLEDLDKGISGLMKKDDFDKFIKGIFSKANPKLNLNERLFVVDILTNGVGFNELISLRQATLAELFEPVSKYKEDFVVGISSVVKNAFYPDRNIKKIPKTYEFEKMKECALKGTLLPNMFLKKAIAQYLNEPSYTRALNINGITKNINMNRLLSKEQEKLFSQTVGKAIWAIKEILGEKYLNRSETMINQTIRKFVKNPYDSYITRVCSINPTKKREGLVGIRKTLEKIHAPEITELWHIIKDDKDYYTSLIIRGTIKPFNEKTKNVLTNTEN